MIDFKEGMVVRLLNKDEFDNKYRKGDLLDYTKYRIMEDIFNLQGELSYWVLQGYKIDGYDVFIKQWMIAEVIYTPACEESEHIISTLGQDVNAEMITIAKSEYELLKRVFDKFVGDNNE